MGFWDSSRKGRSRVVSRHGAPEDLLLAPGVGAERGAREEPAREQRPRCRPIFIAAADDDVCVVIVVAVVVLFFDVSCRPAAEGGPRVRRRDRRRGSRWPRCGAEAQAGESLREQRAGGKRGGIFFNLKLALDVPSQPPLSSLSSKQTNKKLSAPPPPTSTSPSPSSRRARPSERTPSPEPRSTRAPSSSSWARTGPRPTPRPAPPRASPSPSTASFTYRRSRRGGSLRRRR